jgi:5'-nucleotidase
VLLPYARRIIALDIDDVLLDLVTPWVAKYAALTGHQLTKADIRSWDMGQYTRPEWRERFYDLRTPDIYVDMCPIEGAQAGVEELLHQGHTLVALTHDQFTHVGPKAKRLRQLFPGLQHIVFAKEKRAALHFDLLIDDGPHNYPEMLFDQPWNKNSPSRVGDLGGVRVYGWADIPWRLGSC